MKKCENCKYYDDVGGRGFCKSLAYIKVERGCRILVLKDHYCKEFIKVRDVDQDESK